jgi:hypothetical protein
MVKIEGRIKDKIGKELNGLDLGINKLLDFNINESQANPLKAFTDFEKTY